MSLFNKPPVEDHGESLVQEFETFVESIKERTEHRTAVVKGRLAALEHELETHLEPLVKRLK